jgi:transcriptional regulator with XRE-family HTH domain
MAIQNLHEKLADISITPSRNSKQEAKSRTDNREWLNKSFEIAVLVLKTLRDRGWSQKNLAERMGVSQQHISKIVKGKENLTLLTISKLEDVLEIVIIGLPLKQESVSFTKFDTSYYESRYSSTIITTKSIKGSVQKLNSTGAVIHDAQFTPRIFKFLKVA